MGLKGLVRRSQDTHVIHANIDTDVVVSPVPIGRDFNGLMNTRKPIELYEIIERFALGRRKLELFGTSRNIRSGWLTVGEDLEDTSFDRSQYSSWFRDVYTTGDVVASTADATMNANQPWDEQTAISPDSAILLAQKNAYPVLTTFIGGKYEGTSQSKHRRLPGYQQSP